MFLADNVGADAFAVATLEEGIALRKAFQQTPPGAPYQPGKPLTANNSSTVSTLFQGHSEAQTTITPPNTSNNKNGQRRRRFQRASQIRIVVLGPPVGFPRCFDDYLFHNIEAMISGPEVAKSLLEWVCNTDERKRTQVERAAAETKELAMTLEGPRPTRPTPLPNFDRKESSTPEASVGENSEESNTTDSVQRFHPPSATLSNVTGKDLAKEVREILKNQKLANPPASTASITHASGLSDSNTCSTNTSGSSAPKSVTTQVFAGIEEAAKISRSRHKAIAKETYVENGEDEGTKTNHKVLPAAGSRKRLLRWHALVDSGMGRLGFRTDPVSKTDQGKRRDTVEILRELVDLEDSLDTPVEFFGMCTHMADANSNSDYTHAQIAKFKVTDF